MKNIFYKLLILVVAPLLAVSCDDKDAFAELNSNAVVTANLSNSSVVLEASNADAEALTITWSEPDFGYKAAPSYTIYLDNAGDNFGKPEKISAGKELQKTLTVSELNAILLKLELEQGSPADVEVKVVAELGDYNGIESSAVMLNATAYQDKLDLSTTWGLVGSATVNGWDGPDMPFFQTETADVYVAYVTLVDGAIKFRENNSWDNNYGDTDADGSIEPNGTDITIEAGTYKITLDLAANTWSKELFTWGLVGSATTNAWDGPDMPLEYDPYSDTWKAIVTLVEGEIKVRKNNTWGGDYGDVDSDGILDQEDGNNIAVTAGTYLVTVNLKDLSYSLESIDVWGIVGSATPNAWDGPDTKFKLDYSQENVWYLNNMTLIDGEIKFRQNDAWDVNYGDIDGDKILDTDDGNNIVVTAGTYNFTLDFSNPDSPTYTME
ncbi:SusF/SusE family outer membrane protein [Aureibaculum algae]|uniref:SusF/SusE family outer membrane protein n=1 Tax=Aureibaculum algae TaxID=2584122 RepID=A0A5B7TY16_9FLAO|nr:SusE domain-containing protein [Aureibaculum algae]QCX40161.1 SusF/SusE family outer membrane protein [Aureibaculum algae]